MIESIVLDGTPVKQRFSVIINHRGYKLTFESFRLLTILLVARTKGDGWLESQDLSLTGLQWTTAIYRLRSSCPDIEIENDKTGRYRIVVDCKKIFFNHKQLVQFPDHAVRVLFE